MFQAWKNLFKPKKFLGIDIGTSFIRVVEIERRKSEYRLGNYGYLGDDQPFLASNGKNMLSLSDSKTVAETIKAILEKTGIKTKDVNFSIPDFNSFFTSFDLPVMDKKEIAGAIKYQVRPFVLLPLEELDLDWLIIEGQPSKTPLKVLVVAIPKEIIVQYQKIAELVGLDLRFLESEVFSLARAVINNDKFGDNKKVVGLVDIGSWSTTCSVIEKGVLKNSYSFNIAGNELTKVIDKALNVNYNKAEELKKKYGLLSADSARDGENLPPDTFPKILTPLTDSILREIKRVFRDFYRLEGKEIEKVVLSGGTALMPGLKEYFADNLQKEVVIANPFSNLSYPKPLEPVLRELGPIYGVAVGLALKGLE
ncbi:MAG TPA: type IV pilus assembly protein PilM [Candidatus Parcubacteria bacterium]|nr:type IV pilus assembly protein PilM [Candidatus Parcubacteria bacterium]